MTSPKSSFFFRRGKEVTVKRDVKGRFTRFRIVTTKIETWKGDREVEVSRDKKGRFVSWKEIRKEWIRCSISVKTRDPKTLRTLDVDATVTTKGERPVCVRALQKLMFRDCGSKLPLTVYDSNDYWLYEGGEWFYLPRHNIEENKVDFEFPDEKLERVTEEEKVISCR